MSDRIIKIEAVKAKTGQARSTIYDKIAAGDFPAPVKLGKRAVGWLESEVEQWLAGRIASRDKSKADHAERLKAVREKLDAASIITEAARKR